MRMVDAVSGSAESGRIRWAVAICMALLMLYPAMVPTAHKDLSEKSKDATASPLNGPNGQSPLDLSSKYASLVNYSDVLLIRNVNSADSTTIADYFRSERNISWAHVCNVTTSTNEEIDAATFTALAGQVKSCISALPPGTTINFLVTTKGVPLKTWRSYSGDWTLATAASVDSELALLGGPYEGQVGQPSWMNDPYFDKFVPFTRARFGFYIVTRLTAFTVPESLGLVDRATGALGRRGDFVFDVDPGKDGGAYQVGNDWMRAAASILTARGFDVTLDQTYSFLSNYSRVAGYFSWGSNDGAWYSAVNSNSGFEADADSNGVPDGWFYDDPAGTANVTWNSSVVESGSRSMRIQRPAIDNNYSAVSENFTPVPESRYFLAGSVNLTLGVAGRGIFLQFKSFDASDRLLSVQNGSAVPGNSRWTGLPQVIYEPAPGAAKLRASVVFAQANGTAFIDNARLIEIRPHNRWIPGALAETAVSTGGRTFIYGTGYGQSLVADLIQDGVTGVKGYVYEPYLDAIAHADVLFDAYTRGYTLAESYMMASEWGLSWMDTIIGDPKLAPYNMSYLPDLAVSPGDITFSNRFPNPGDIVDVGATVHNIGRFPAENATVSFYLGDPRQNGTLIGNGTVTVLDGGSSLVSLRLTSPLRDGWYDVCVFADSPNDFYEANESNNIACSRIGVTTTWAIHLPAGHRFVSFPLFPVNDSIESVLSSLAGCYDYARFYSAADSQDPWKSYVPGRASNSLLHLDNEMGFWIDMTAGCDLVVTGVRPDATFIPLSPGWNMVGFPSFNLTYTVGLLKAALATAGIVVEVFDAGAPPYFLKRAGDANAIVAGEGYWIRATTAANWNVPG